MVLTLCRIVKRMAEREGFEIDPMRILFIEHDLRYITNYFNQ